MQDARYPNQIPGSALRHRAMLSRIVRSTVFGVVITLLLTGVEIALLWFLYPLHPPAKNALAHLSGLLTLPLAHPLLWLIPLGELIALTMIAFREARPLAIRAYVQAIQKAQETYRTRDTSLTSLTNVYETPVTYYQHTPDPLQVPHSKKLTLNELPQATGELSLLLLGAAGTGKTLALHYFDYLASQERWGLIREPGQRKLSLFIPLQNYSIFLQKQQLINFANDSQPQELLPADIALSGSFLQFLLTCNLPGMNHLLPYMQKLFAQGRLLLLCDGLDEVDQHYRQAVGRELAELVLTTENRFVISCRDIDYQKQAELLGLVNEGHIERAVLEPLSLETVREFIERYIHDQGNSWQHTAGQLMQLITHSRLQYLCPNPLLLFTFLAIIDKAGVERGKTLDTRGRLLQEYVSQVIKRTLASTAWKQQSAPTEKEVKWSLSLLASMAHCSYDVQAIELPLLAKQPGETGFYETVAEECLSWLNAHPARSLFAATQANRPDSDLLARILHFSQDAGLIEIARAERESQTGNILSFRHELLADYFIANYFLVQNDATPSALTALTPMLVNDPAYWSVPIALWACLVDNPVLLAEQFIALSKLSADYTVQTAALSLIPTGVAWTSPVAAQRGNRLPPRQATTMLNIVQNGNARERLAELLTACTAAGASELHHAIYPLIMIDGIEELLLLLEPTRILPLLFGYLQETADLAAYENEVKRLCRVLWQFGTEAVPFASTLSRPAPGRSLRLRTAALNILGGTASEEAVEPLMERLDDTDTYIVDRAIKSLQRLGPALSLERMLAELEHSVANTATRRVHAAILVFLTRLLGEQESKEGKSSLTPDDYQRILDTLILMLGARSSWESDIQKQAQALLVRLGTGQILLPASTTTPTNAPITRPLSQKTREKTISLLTHYLASGDEMLTGNVVHTLEEIGNVATPYLLERLRQQPPETVRMRIIEILQQVQDNRALPDILLLVADTSPIVQKQVLSALQSYGNDSISGLLDLILTHPDEQVAERAAHILGEMGEKAIIPTMQALTRVVPGRTRLLVLVLDSFADQRTLSALIALLRKAQSDPLLQIAVIRTLSHFATPQVVPPILTMLASAHVQIYEEAIEALSTLGPLALPELIAALNTALEIPTTARIHRAILGMVPFPGEQLLDALPACSEAQAQHIMAIFRVQGAEAAHILVQNLFNADEHTRYYVRHTLRELPGSVAVPALVEMLPRAPWRQLLSEFLLAFPESAIPTLVNLLSDPERGSAAAGLLPTFGPAMLPALVTGLDDPRDVVQEYAQSIIVHLVQQNPDAISQVVHLFALSLPLRAHEALLEVLINDLVSVCIPALLAGLEDAHLIEDVSEALVRLNRKREWQDTILSGLLAALDTPVRRRGAEMALIKVGSSAVRPVGELITDPNPAVAQAAQHILSEIGVPALPFIWTAHGDMSNRKRRDAAMNIFRSMPTDVIKDALVNLLGSDLPEDMAMAMALLLERIHDEASLPPANREMIPALLEQVLIHDRERSSLRILALLLLLGGKQVIAHLVEVLYEQPQHDEQLVHAFLFLGDEAREALLEILKDTQAPTKLRAEAISMLGLLGSTNEPYEYARSLSTYGLSPNRSSLLKPDQLAIALRALGGLLASGDWDIPTLQNLRQITPESSAQSELYSVLLGWRYQPEMIRLSNELQNEREARKNEIMNLTARIVHDQAHIRELSEELEQVRYEHGERGDELFQVTQEREDFRSNLEHTVQERDTYRQSLAQSQQEREIILATLEQLRQEKVALQEEVAHLETYNATLLQQIRIQRGTSQ